MINQLFWIKQLSWKYFSFYLLFIVSFLLPLNHASSQANNDKAYKENIQIIATTNRITIDTNFSGTDIYIAGVLENADPSFRQQGRYDIVMVMQGPSSPMIMREKKRIMGFWINADSLFFNNVPQFYALLSTKELRTITKASVLRALQLGVDDMVLSSNADSEEKQVLYRQQLIELKQQEKLYSQTIGDVQFGSPSLFTAKFHLPANVPVGQYKVQAYLFRDGQFINQVSIPLQIAKDHIAFEIYNAASQYSLLYGIAAVVVAIITGFMGRIIFRND